MLIKVTTKGTITRMTKPELVKMQQVHEMLDVLATNRPMVTEYGEAAIAIAKVLQIFKGQENANPCPDRE